MEVIKWIFIISGICIAFGIIAFLFSKITLRFSFSKQIGKKPDGSLEISLFGKLLKKQITKNNKTHVRKPEDTKEKPYDDMGFFAKTKLWYEKFLIFKAVYKKSSPKIRKAIHATKIDFSLDFGTGDAFKTGIATGTVWTAIYNVIAFVSRFIRITEPKITVNPEFNGRLCSFRGECIIKARLVNLIRVILTVGINYYFISRKYKNKKRKGGD